MKQKSIVLIFSTFIILLAIYFFINNNNNKTNNSNENSQSNIDISNVQTSNSNLDIESNNSSNITSNEVQSNINSNVESNIIITSNRINSNNKSNSNISSNSNKKSNTSNVISNTNSNSKSNNKSNSNTLNNQYLKTNGKFSGVYKNNDVELKIYQHNNKLDMDIVKYSNNSVVAHYINNCTINNKVATCDKNTININDNSITYSKINNYFQGGTLYKIKEYTAENYYVDFMQYDIKYSNSSYNGVYYNNEYKDTIKIYQTSSNEYNAVMSITRKKEGVRDNTVPEIFNKTIVLEKNGNKLVGNTNYGHIEISYDKNKISVSASSSNIKDILYHVNIDNNPINYSYQRKYPISEIVSDVF